MSMYDFVEESNAIEDIVRGPSVAEVKEHTRFVMLPEITVEEVERFVSIYEPEAKLRDQFGMDVVVGKHKPIIGNPNMRNLLSAIIENMDKESIYGFHNVYETLHPFTDCNGRSGRAIWAWMMFDKYRVHPESFLHEYYYQSLDNWRK